MKTIRGKKALITGAASGLGRAIALRLAREGADVYLWDIDESGLAETAREATALGVEAIVARCDLSRPAEITAAVQSLLARWPDLDILVNNAGVGFYGPMHTMTAAQWDWLMAINLLAPIQITRELLPTLLNRPEAHVVNMASICGLVAGGRFAAYHTSKFGLVGFTESLRAEYGRQGLGVTALCPGPVQTNLYKSSPHGVEKKPTPTPPAWVCTTPERVAAATIRAIYRDKRMVLLTPLARTLFFLKRFAPWLLDALHRVGRRRKMREKAERLARREAEKETATNRRAA